MTDCNVTLALAYGPGEPYASDNIKAAATEEYSAGQYRVTTAYEQIPLTNPPSVVPFPQGGVFGFLEPGDKTPRFKLIPSTDTADYDDLVDVVPVVDPPGFLGDSVMKSVLADPDSESRKFVDELFAETAEGAVTDAAVGSIVNNGSDTKDALGDEADDNTSPLGESIQGAALVAALIYGGN